MTAAPQPTSSPVSAALQKIALGESLSRPETTALFDEIMRGEVSPQVIGTILLGLRTRGEHPDELAGAVTSLRALMLRVAHQAVDSLVDTCGTGGGEITTLNVSTAAAFVTAGAGIPVAKHGNRSYSSRSGSADVLEAMGIGISASPADAERILGAIGLVFLFAPTYHPAMRHVGPVRAALKVPTIMNLVGPLANPAGVRRQVIGVSDPSRLALVANALTQLDTLHAWVVRGDVGIDEISPMKLTRVIEVKEGQQREWSLDPAGVGLATTSLDGLSGGEPHENAARIIDLFSSPAKAAPALVSAVLLNAAAAILVSGKVDVFADAVASARASLEEGKALAQLEALRQASPRSA